MLNLKNLLVKRLSWAA